MGIYVREMFNSQAEDTSLVYMKSGTTSTAGTFSPPVDGKLVKVILMWAGEAVTSLIEAVRVELESTIWTPNRMHFGLVGANIRTAPSTHVPAFEYVVDQPVKTSHPITGQIVHPTAATPVTSNLRVFGVFTG